MYNNKKKKKKKGLNSFNPQLVQNFDFLINKINSIRNIFLTRQEPFNS